MEAIRKAGLKVIVDPMYGVGQLTLGIVLTEARCRVTFIHERHNPLFGGRSPAPSMEGLRMLSSQMQEEGYDAGLAMDGDADIPRVSLLQRCHDAALLLPIPRRCVSGENEDIRVPSSSIALMTGASLITSGLVPKTNMIDLLRESI